jgi:hypothetical protein
MACSSELVRRSRVGSTTSTPNEPATRPGLPTGTPSATILRVRTRLHALLSLALLWQPACRSSPSDSAADAAGCASGIEVPKVLAVPGGTLILGELHGTQEVPMFAADVTCHLLDQGHRVVLALEIPTTEQERIHRFLASSGDAAARADLVASDYWTFPMQDGRRSQAIVELLAKTQQWASARAPIEVVAFDAEVPPAERDAAMAETLAAARRSTPDAVFLVVTGGLHAMRTPTPDFEPMAARFEAMVAPSQVRSLRMAHAGGSAWLCTEECGPHQLEGQRRATRTINLFVRPTEGFDGEFYVGPLHASPPAVAESTNPPDPGSRPHAHGHEGRGPRRR